MRSLLKEKEPTRSPSPLVLPLLLCLVRESTQARGREVSLCSVILASLTNAAHNNLKDRDMNDRFQKRSSLPPLCF